MLKVMAVLRTLFLVFIVGYLLRELPVLLLMSSDSKQGNITISIELLKQVASVAWLAIGWVALETALGWLRIWLEARKAAKAAAPPPPPPEPKGA